MVKPMNEKETEKKEIKSPISKEEMQEMEALIEVFKKHNKASHAIWAMLPQIYYQRQIIDLLTEIRDLLLPDEGEKRGRGRPKKDKDDK
jgi:hypothetical protein